MDNIIVAKDLVKEFPSGSLMRDKVRVLDNVSFEIPYGENVAIIGPNGCGKTTLLKTIATIYIPDSGDLIIDGLGINKDIKKIRERVNIISPGMRFHNKLTLKETLKFFAGVLNRSYTDIFPFLERVGLNEKLDTRLESFSEGQKAMMRLSIGLLNNPKILILDEFTATLDVERKEEIIDLIAEIEQERCLTILMVDHDMTVIDRLCHKIIILDQKGKIAKVGTMEELTKFIPYEFDSLVVPKKPMEKKYWDSFDFPYELIGHKARFFLHSKNEVTKLAEKLIDNDEHILEYTMSGIRLEDVYLFWLSTQK